MDDVKEDEEFNISCECDTSGKLLKSLDIQEVGARK